MRGHRMHFNYAGAALIGLVAPALGSAQACPQARAWRVAAIAGTFTAAQTIALAAEHDAWWTTPRSSFHLTWDPSANRGQDRMLHAAIGYHASQAGAAAFRWACVPRALSAWLGAVVGTLVEIPKEIGDGLHADKGFSGPDITAAVLGSVLPALQRSSSAAGAFALKVNYWPSREYRHRTGPEPRLETDYAGQRYYLAVAPGTFDADGGPWPRWLGLAVGHSVPYWASLPPVHTWYVTLDLNARGLPIRGRQWKVAAWLIDQVHIPAPGVRLQEGVVSVGLF